MALLTTRAVVLQTYRYSDTSKILRLMTRDRGPCSALAKGALRPMSRFGGLLEPFAEGDATLYVKEGRELHTLSGFELVRERRAIGRDLGPYTAASVMCELVMRLAPEHRDDGLYRALAGGLDALTARDEDGRAAGLRHIWALVATLGFRPDVQSCAACRREIGDERACFDFEAGGLRCADCPPGGPGVRREELASLRRLVLGADPIEPVVGPQGRWLADFIRYHMTEGASLRSLPFLDRLP
ncbi:MAG: DNA repair protein RecO [Gemmatimonadota bacterium]